MDAPNSGAVWLTMRQRTSECVTKSDATDFVGHGHFVEILNTCILSKTKLLRERAGN